MIFSTFQIMHLLNGQDCGEVLRETIEFVCRSEELGFSNVWLAEHHTNYCINGSPSIVASAIAAKTHRMGIGHAVNILPFSHPLRLAEELLLLDHLSKGRLIAGFGSGNQKREFDMFGLDFEQRREMAKESLEIIRRLWSGEAISVKGKYYTLENARLPFKPFQNPHPPICFSVSSKEGAAAMGSLGFHISITGPALYLRDKVQAYRESCPPNFRGHVGYLRNMYLRKDTIDYGRVRGAMRCFAQLLTGNDNLDDKTASSFYEAMGLYRTCSDMIEDLMKFEALGIDEILCSFKWGDLSYQEAMLSMEIFAEDIIPAFS